MIKSMASVKILLFDIEKGLSVKKPGVFFISSIISFMKNISNNKKIQIVCNGPVKCFLMEIYCENTQKEKYTEELTFLLNFRLFFEGICAEYCLTSIRALSNKLAFSFTLFAYFLFLVCVLNMNLSFYSIHRTNFPKFPFSFLVMNLTFICWTCRHTYFKITLLNYN